MQQVSIEILRAPYSWCQCCPFSHLLYRALLVDEEEEEKKKKQQRNKRCEEGEFLERRVI